MAARKLDAALQSEGIRAIVTSRAKSIQRLESKLQNRARRKNYTSLEQIYADIVDLAGVRIALYFPGEKEGAGRIITRNFDEYESRREFPAGDGGPTGNGRFSGYSALHYRVRLRPVDLDESHQRYGVANIEIQIASALMHAWSEVEHDLVYKPFQGELSQSEYSLLDQLNGLVIAGEISLEQLQQAGEARVAQTDRKFANHYELAAHLLSSASNIDDTEVTDEGLGRVDLLFALISQLDLGTPKDLKPYLISLHGDLDRRPLAEQIIDALLSEEQGRYKIFRNIRSDHDARSNAGNSDPGVYHEVGRFLEQWIRLERAIRRLVPNGEERHQAMPSGRLLKNLQVIDDESRFDLEQLRRMRNQLVHGLDIPSPEQLRAASDRVEGLIQKLEPDGP